MTKKGSTRPEMKTPLSGNVMGQPDKGRKVSIMNKKIPRWNRLKHFLLFAGWLAGAIACSWILDRTASLSYDLSEIILILLISVCGLPALHKQVLPILRPPRDGRQFPWYWPLLVGLASGVVGRLIAYGLTEPELLFNQDIL
jgi:uncharacterized membrane protein YfcA